jgi:ribosomal protein L11 methyltransferase
MEYLQFHFPNITQTQSEILIAQLNEICFDGFEEEINVLKAYIPSNLFDENLFNQIINISNVNFSKSIIKKENWNAIWEANFEPIEVYYPNSTKQFVYIRAGFHPPKVGFDFDITITPKMSFGTGHHPTTYLVVEQMSNINFRDKTVIDFGTGTAVLAILAEKLEAKDILGIDIDDWSIENAAENAIVNGCEKIRLLKADSIPTTEEVDIILANINLNIITGNIKTIKAAAKKDGTILFSGIMVHDKDKIINVIEKEGIMIKKIVEKDNWLALLCVNGQLNLQ